MPDERVDINDVIAELDPLGRALLDAAQLRVIVKRLTAENTELRNSTASTSPTGPA